MSLDMFQLGLALGTGYGNLWAANADKRQSKKADKIIDDIKNQQEMAQIEALRQPEPNPTMGERAAAERLNTQMQGMDGNYTFSVPSAAEQFKAYNPVQDAVDRSNKAGLDAIAAHAANKQGMNPAQRAAYTWNKGYTENNVREALDRAGIRSGIINDKMKRVREDVAEQARAALMPQIQNYMYGQFVETDDGNGGKVVSYKAPSPADYGNAINSIMELRKYDPDGAKALMSGLVLPKDIYAQQERARLAQQGYANKKALQDEKMANQVLLKSMAGGGKGNSGGLKFSDYQKLLEVRDGLMQKFADNDDQLSEEDQQTYNYISQQIALYENGGGAGQGNSNNSYTAAAAASQQVDKDDWNSVNSAVDTLIKQNVPKNQIIGALMEMYPPDHPWLQNFISSMTHSSSKTAENSASEAGGSTMFPNWQQDQQGHVGVLADLESHGLADILGRTRDWARRKDGQ